MDVNPDELTQSERYKLLIGAIVPRPIALVSTVGPDGIANLAPFSFFAGVSSEPMSLLFCPANKSDGSIKDTLRNCLLPNSPHLTGGISPLRGQGDFVVNIVPDAIAHRMAACAEELPFGESEFALSGLTPASSMVVTPPRVGESPMSFECRTMQIIHLAPGAPAGGNIVLGRVVAVHALDGLINDRTHVDAARLDAIGRMGGSSYCRTRDRFEMPMGRKALEQPRD